MSNNVVEEPHPTTWDVENLPFLLKLCSDPREVALERIRTRGSIASDATRFLRDAYERWSADMDASSSSSAAAAAATKTLTEVVRVHSALARADPTLYEEIGREGAHVVLSRVVRFEVCSSSELFSEELVDDVFDLQDACCEIIGVVGGGFPSPYAPFTEEEVASRLPLSYAVTVGDDDDDVPRRADVLIHQVSERQSAQDDVGFVVWPSAVVLVNHLVAHPDLFRGKTVLELGAGCGLSGIAVAVIAREAASSSTSATTSVILTDVNPKVIANLNRNVVLNGFAVHDDQEGVAATIETASLDFYQQRGTSSSSSDDDDGREQKSDDASSLREGWTTTDGDRRPPVDVVVGADVVCRPEDAVAVARTLRDCLRPGGRAVIVCADATHRYGVDVLERACADQGLTVTCEKMEDVDDGQCSRRGDDGDGALESTSGYVENMTLLLFRITKA